VNSIAACCHSVKLCTHAGWAFPIATPDEKFNKKPNNAKEVRRRPKRLFKGQKENQTLFAVLPILCNKKQLIYKSIKKFCL